MIIETERLYMRQMNRDDFHSLCKILQDEKVMYAYEGAFNILKANEVCSIIRDTNIPSQNVAIRNDMTKKDEYTKHYKGIDMPHYRYVITNQHWNERNMIIIITGASHTGKTNLAQKLLERYKYPYLSIDHLKMGLIRIT